MSWPRKTLLGDVLTLYAEDEPVIQVTAGNDRVTNLNAEEAHYAAEVLEEAAAEVDTWHRESAVSQLAGIISGLHVPDERAREAARAIIAAGWVKSS